jgi:hypothetical protein
MFSVMFKPHNSTLQFGILINHLKPNNLQSGLYLSRGYTQVSPAVAVQFKPKGLHLSYGASLSAGPMISEPVFGNEDKTKPPNTYIPFASLTPGLEQNMQHVGWGATVSVNISLHLTRRLSISAAANIHGDASRKLQYITEEKPSVITRHYEQFQSVSRSFSLGIAFAL